MKSSESCWPSRAQVRRTALLTLVQATVVVAINGLVTVVGWWVQSV